MAQRLLTEDGRLLITEAVAGVVGGSTLNDTLVYELLKETFTTNPALSGWSIGTGWAWSAVNGNMAVA